MRAEEPEIRFTVDARTATPHFPGIGRYVSNLVKHLPAQMAAHEQLLVINPPRLGSAYSVTDPSETRPDLEKPRKEEEARAARVQTPSTPFSLSQQWAIPRLLQRRHSTIYHSPYYLMPYWTRTPTVLTVYDLIPHLLPHTCSWQARIGFRFALRAALKAADRVICISAATRKDLVQYFHVSEGRIRTIPLAVDPQFQPGSEAVRTALRQRYTLPDPYLLYVGTLKPHKNLARLVQAHNAVMAQARTGGQPVPSLVFAGPWERADAPYQALLATSADPASIKGLGHIPDADLPALYASALGFVYPSLYEGFGLPVLEAMACGTPVICSCVSSLPEVAGAAAVLIDPNSIPSMAEALTALVGKPELRNELSVKGLQRSRQFSWQRTASETVGVYRELALARNRQGGRVQG